MDLSDQNPHITAVVNGPNDFEEISRRTPSTNLGIDPNIRQSHVDQFLVGLERELIPNVSMTAQYIKRNFRDFMGFIDTGSIYSPVTKMDTGAGRQGRHRRRWRSYHGVRQDKPGARVPAVHEPVERVPRLHGLPVDRHQALREQLAGVGVVYLVSHHGTVGNNGGTNAGAGSTSVWARPARSPIRTTGSTSTVMRSSTTPTR